MPAHIAAIWQKPFPGLRRTLTDAVDSIGWSGAAAARVFFRADDIGAADANDTRLIELFSRYGVPLALAVVPGWLTREKWRQLSAACKTGPQLFCWHQHGWQHVNHEPGGKKQEFGPARTISAIRRDLRQGRQRMAAIMGDAFYPVFTPPWNRCSGQTLQCLRQAGFAAVSRYLGAEPESPPGLPDVQMHVDLHTRKELDGRLGWQNLLASIRKALSAGSCGFMLHHQRMNENAFFFLEQLLQIVAGHPRLEVVGFKELINEFGT